MKQILVNEMGLSPAKTQVKKVYNTRGSGSSDKKDKVVLGPKARSSTQAKVSPRATQFKASGKKVLQASKTLARSKGAASSSRKPPRSQPVAKQGTSPQNSKRKSKDVDQQSKPIKKRVKRSRLAVRPIVVSNEPVKEKGALGSYAECLKRAKALLRKIREKQHVLEVYQADGQKGTGRERVALSAEINNAQEAMAAAKDGLRQCWEYCEMAQGDTPIPADRFDPEGRILEQHIFCARCQTYNVQEGNDIVLCDGPCQRAYHQRCLPEPLDLEQFGEDEGWYCPACDCKYEILCEICRDFGQSYELEASWEDIHLEHVDHEDQGGCQKRHMHTSPNGQLPQEMPQGKVMALKVLGGADLPDEDEEDDESFMAGSSGTSSGSSSTDDDDDNDGDNDEEDEAAPGVPLEGSGCHRPRGIGKAGEVLSEATGGEGQAVQGSPEASVPSPDHPGGRLGVGGDACRRPRRRPRVNYAKLNDLLFPQNGHSWGDESEDEEYMPIKGRKKPAVS